MRKIKFRIMGKIWVIRIMPNRKFIRKHGDDCLAITIFHKNRIDIARCARSKDTVVHELVHAYLDEMCVTSTSMSKDDMEEVFAELMAKRGAELLALAKDLTQKMKNL